jgi:hypothetical protein
MPQAVVAITHRENMAAQATLRAAGFRHASDTALAARFDPQADERLFVARKPAHA